MVLLGPRQDAIRVIRVIRVCLRTESSRSRSMAEGSGSLIPPAWAQGAARLAVLGRPEMLLADTRWAGAKGCSWAN